MNRYGKYFLSGVLWLEDAFCSYYVQDARFACQEIPDVPFIRYFSADDARQWLMGCFQYNPYTTGRRLRGFLIRDDSRNHLVHRMDDDEVIDAVARELLIPGSKIVVSPRCGGSVQVDADSPEPLVPVRVEPEPDVGSLVDGFAATLDDIVSDQQKRYDEIDAGLAELGWAGKKLEYGRAAFRGILRSRQH